MRNVLAIIQARGGSKGVPGKNIRLFAGKPLIAWTVEAALGANTVTRTIVSTDSEEIAAVARAAGAEAPFLRPAEFASDTAKSIGLLTHALDWLAEHEQYAPDVVVQLKPTNPLRTAAHIDEAVRRFEAVPDADSLITVTRSPAHPLKTYQFEGVFVRPFLSGDLFGLTEASKLPRQQLPEVFVQNSCVNVIAPRTIRELKSSLGKRVVGMTMDRRESLNIDDLMDFEIGEFLMTKQRGAR